MNNLVNILNKDGQLVVSSRQVAENFEKRHDHTLRAIETIIENDSTQNWGQYFIPSEYKDNSGKSNKEYLLTRDGFSILVMGFTGPKALQWKLKYIDAFNKMEQALKEVPLSIEDMMIKQLEEQKKIKAEITATKEDVNILKHKVDNQITLDHGQQRVIQREVGTKVYQRLENILIRTPIKATENDIDNIKRKLFNSLYKDIKNRFGVPSYRDIKTKDLDLAINYIKNWIEPQELREVC